MSIMIMNMTNAFHRNYKENRQCAKWSYAKTFSVKERKRVHAVIEPVSATGRQQMFEDAVYSELKILCV